MNYPHLVVTSLAANSMGSESADITASADGAAAEVQITPLRIAQVIGDLRIGGAEKHFVSLMNALPADHRLAVLTSPRVAEPNLIQDLQQNVHCVRVGIRKRSALIDIWKLVKVLRSEKCNVVQTHMFWPNLYGSIAARFAGVDVVITTEHGENRWKKPFHRWLERNVISRIADFRYCVSDAILQNRRDVDNVPPRQLRVIANGTRVPEHPAQLWSNDVPVIGSVGRFVTQKNYLLLLDTIAALLEKGFQVRACIVGDGPEMSAVKQRISDLKLQDIVELPGMVTDVEPWFRKFDLYAITSREEGQPVSLLEAMSYGLPIVSTDVGAISVTMEHGFEGSIVPSGDKDQFANALGRYLDDRDFAAMCGRNARARVVRDFSIEAIAGQYAACYREVLASKYGQC